MLHSYWDSLTPQKELSQKILTRMALRVATSALMVTYGTMQMNNLLCRAPQNLHASAGLVSNIFERIELNINKLAGFQIV